MKVFEDQFQSFKTWLMITSQTFLFVVECPRVLLKWTCLVLTSIFVGGTYDCMLEQTSLCPSMVF